MSRCTCFLCSYITHCASSNTDIQHELVESLLDIDLGMCLISGRCFGFYIWFHMYIIIVCYLGCYMINYCCYLTQMLCLSSLLF